MTRMTPGTRLLGSRPILRGDRPSSLTRFAPSCRRAGTPQRRKPPKAKHLNVWAGADEALFSMRAWRESTDLSLTLDDFQGCQCYIEIDPASKTDLAAIVLLFPETDDDGTLTYAAFARCDINEAVMAARNASCPGWAADGDLTVTPGTRQTSRPSQPAPVSLLRHLALF